MECIVELDVLTTALDELGLDHSPRRRADDPWSSSEQLGPGEDSLAPARPSRPSMRLAIRSLAVPATPRRHSSTRSIFPIAGPTPSPSGAGTCGRAGCAPGPDATATSLALMWMLCALTSAMSPPRTSWPTTRACWSAGAGHAVRGPAWVAVSRTSWPIPTRASRHCERRRASGTCSLGQELRRHVARGHDPRSHLGVHRVTRNSSGWRPSCLKPTRRGAVELARA